MLQLLLGAAVGAAAAPGIRAGAGRLQKTGHQLSGQVWLMMVATAIAGAAVATLSGAPTIIAYAAFAAAIVTAAFVDVAEQRIPDLITYPLLIAGVVGLPWLGGRPDLWTLLAPAIGAAASGFWALISALIGDQGLGDVKLAAAIGAWMAHLGILPWAVGVALGQILMVVVVGGAMLRRRKRGLPHAHTALGPALTAGALIAVAIAGTGF